jgi:hypothetical protein
MMEVNMELKEFVAETLKQIVEGLVVAQEHVKDKGATINPQDLTSTSGFPRYYTCGDGTNVQMIEFDVSLIATEGKEAGGHIGVFFGSLGAGARGKSETENSATNRVKFSVPIILPSNSQSKQN